MTIADFEAKFIHDRAVDEALHEISRAIRDGDNARRDAARAVFLMRLEAK